MVFFYRDIEPTIEALDFSLLSNVLTHYFQFDDY
jgi:hypothetical protein